MSLTIFKKFNLTIFIFLNSITTLAIQNGKDIPKSWFQSLPPTVRVQTDLSCVATFFSSKVLLIPGHCVENLGTQYSNIDIVSPETNLTETKRARVFKHPNYKIGFRNNPTIEDSVNDIAVIVLAESLKEERDFALLPEGPANKSLFTFISNGPNAKGKQNDNQFEMFDIYRQTKTGHDGNPVQGSLAVPRNKETEVCVGDSGGGFFSIEEKKWTMVAMQSVVANIQTCGGTNSQNYAVPLIKHVDWISKFLPKQQATMTTAHNGSLK